MPRPSWETLCGDRDRNSCLGEWDRLRQATGDGADPMREFGGDEASSCSCTLLLDGAPTYCLIVATASQKKISSDRVCQALARGRGYRLKPG